MTARRRLRRLGRAVCAEHGTTIVELVVAMALMMAVVPVLGPVLVSSLRTAGELQAHSAVLDELRLQSFAIGRELRSAECISQPAAGTAGPVLHFTTTAYGSPVELRYEVVAGELVRTDVASATTRVVGRGLVPGTAPPFTHLSTPRVSVELTLPVQLDEGHRPKELTTAVAGRNAWKQC